MSQAVACDAQAVAGVSKLLKIGCRRALVNNLLYQTVGPDILWHIPRHSYSHSPETHLTPLKSARIYLFISATSHLKFAHERHVPIGFRSQRTNNAETISLPLFHHDFTSIGSFSTPPPWIWVTESKSPFFLGVGYICTIYALSLSFRKTPVTRNTAYSLTSSRLINFRLQVADVTEYSSITECSISNSFATIFPK